jgi:pheromone shutdown-related protein TraB
MSSNITTIKLGDREFHILGTAHVSPESVKEVREAIETLEPERVCVELDEARYQTMTQHDSWEKLDLIQVFRQKKGFLLLANLALGSYQRRIGQDMGVAPGSEMKEAIELSESKDIPISLIDRDVRVTLGRAWKKAGLIGKAKLLSTLLASAFDDEEVTEEQIEELKQVSELDQMMGEIGKEFPKAKEILIDERDRYLATKLYEEGGNKLLAVVGAGHVPGMVRYLESLHKKEVETDLSDISSVPPKGFFGSVGPWIIPAVIIGLLGTSVYLGLNQARDAVEGWFFWNALFTFIGGVIALGHPLTILAATAAAPFTSLIPVIGVGMVSGPIEAMLRKPRVEDFETLREDSGSLGGFYKNRILRSLWVFLLTSLGSVAGTLVGGTDLAQTVISQIMDLFAN